MQELNIIDLIEKNPITKLSNTYNNKLLKKIQQNFTENEQHLFVSSFYCYLNYDKNIDFVVDLDDIWRWLGFNQKVKALSLLEKHFTNNMDYKFDLQFGKTDLETVIKQNGGQNIKKYFLTIKCFKSLCLKAQTKKASEIHEYYMKLEETLHEIVEEETNELKLQLEQKDNIISNHYHIMMKRLYTATVRLGIILTRIESRIEKIEVENEQANLSDIKTKIEDIKVYIDQIIHESMPQTQEIFEEIKNNENPRKILPKLRKSVKESKDDIIAVHQSLIEIIKELKSLKEN